MRERSVSADSKGLMGALNPLLCITFGRGGVCCNLRCNWGGAQDGMGSTHEHGGNRAGKDRDGGSGLEKKSGCRVADTGQDSGEYRACQR